MPKRPEPVLTSQLVPLFVAQVRAAGGDVGVLLREFNLPEQAELLPETAIPLRRFHAFSDRAAELAKMPFLGLRTAAGLQRGKYGLIEFISRTATDIEAAIDALIRYSALLNAVVRFSLERGSKDAIVKIQVPSEPLGTGRHGNEFTIAHFTRFIRQTSGRTFASRRVWFAHPAPADTSELRAFFEGTELEFGRGESGMLFDAEVLDWPIITADPELNAVLEDQAKRISGQRKSPEDFTERVRMAVRRAMESGAPSIQRVAPMLHMSERTLQRRLEEHGLAYKDLVDDVRLTQARLYLEDRMMGISEIAFRLGYSDLRSFSRAFSRWTGIPPGEYRESGRH